MDITNKTPPDISSEERFYNRSLRIRREILVWLDGHAGAGYYDFQDLCNDAANSCKPLPCSSITSYRWIRQFTSPMFAFAIDPKVMDESGLYRIRRRRPLTRADFKRWGISPPKRFRKLPKG